MRLAGVAVLRSGEDEPLHPNVSPDFSHAFAAQHDAQIWSCFCTLVGVDPGAIACSARAAPPDRGTTWLEERS